MNLHDIVRVNEPVVVETVCGGFAEIQSGWEGTIVANAETQAPLIEFVEATNSSPMLAHLEASNLTVVWRNPNSPLQ
jgi:hypothetical protein